MMQAVRNNEDRPLYYVEYLRFEINYLKKVVDRANIFNQVDKNAEIDFVDEEMVGTDEENKESTGVDASRNIVKIVFETIQEKFQNLRVFKECWQIVKENKSYLKDDFVDHVRNAYYNCRHLSSNFIEYYRLKVQKEKYQKPDQIPKLLLKV